MPAILRKLPFSDQASRFEVRGRVYPLVHNQILVWVSLGPMGLQDADPRAPRVPAILDTGFTDNFLIHEQQLQLFAGMQLQHFPRVNRYLHTRGRQIPVHAANLWIHPNKPGQRDEFANQEPCFMEMHRGIGISRDADLFPRLPLLGAGALRRSRLHVFIDYNRCRVSMRTPRRFWFFG